MCSSVVTRNTADVKKGSELDPCVSSLISVVYISSLLWSRCLETISGDNQKEETQQLVPKFS